MNKLYRNYKLKVAFSKAAPQDACPSAGRLLHCALLPIRAKCGFERLILCENMLHASQLPWTQNAFSTTKAIKPALPQFHHHQFLHKAVLWADRQRLTFYHKVRRRGTFHSSISISVSSLKKQTQKNGQKYSAFFCRKNFRAGNLLLNFAHFWNWKCITILQLWIRNHFDSWTFLGCTLSAQFRNCVRPITSAPEGRGSCVLSSCIIQAGSGICGQPDVSKAIDTILGCVFKQVTLLNMSKRQIIN